MLIHFLITLVDMNKFSGLSTYIAHYLGFHINHYYLFFFFASTKYFTLTIILKIPSCH